MRFWATAGFIGQRRLGFVQGFVQRPRTAWRRNNQRVPLQVQLSSSACTSSRYCFSYTAVLLILLPFASVPLAVTVRVLPSADRTMRAVVVTLPSFF